MSRHPYQVLTRDHRDGYYTSAIPTIDRDDPRRCLAPAKSTGRRCEQRIKDPLWRPFARGRCFAGKGLLAHEWWNEDDWMERIAYFCPWHTELSGFHEDTEGPFIWTGPADGDGREQAGGVPELMDARLEAGVASSSSDDGEMPLTPAGSDATEEDLMTFSTTTTPSRSPSPRQRARPITDEPHNPPQPPAPARARAPQTQPAPSAPRPQHIPNTILNTLNSLTLGESNAPATAASAQAPPDPVQYPVLPSIDSWRGAAAGSQAPPPSSTGTAPFRPTEVTESEVRRLADRLVETTLALGQVEEAVRRNTEAVERNTRVSGQLPARVASEIERRWAVLRA